MKYGGDKNLKNLVEGAGLNFVLTNDNLTHELVIPGNVEDKHLMSWKENLK